MHKSRISNLLQPFGLTLSSEQVDRLHVYFELLLKWNAKINLVGQTSEEGCITRHFGESLYLARCIDLQGGLLDIGSGAGFPGLALKLTYPSLAVTLLEPVAKKRAFLKEVARICQFSGITVLGSRLEDFASQRSDTQFDLATCRAVGWFDNLIENTAACMNPSGRFCLWLGHGDVASILGNKSKFKWRQPIPIPLSHSREILIGELVTSKT